MPEVRVSGADAERVVRSELLVARVELAINTVGSTTDEIKTALDELRIERQFARQELEKRLGRGRLAIDLSAEEIAQQARHVPRARRARKSRESRGLIRCGSEQSASGPSPRKH